jgi:hypothetical protein
VSRLVAALALAGLLLLPQAASPPRILTPFLFADEAQLPSQASGPPFSLYE